MQLWPGLLTKVEARTPKATTQNGSAEIFRQSAAEYVDARAQARLRCGRELLFYVLKKVLIKPLEKYQVMNVITLVTLITVSLRKKHISQGYWFAVSCMLSWHAVYQ